MRIKPVIAAAALLLLSGCGGGASSSRSVALTADSTCSDYNSQAAAFRHSVAVSLSSQLSASEAGNPIWGTQIDYACKAQPQQTIAQAFGQHSSTAATQAPVDTPASTPSADGQTFSADGLKFSDTGGFQWNVGFSLTLGQAQQAPDANLGFGHFLAEIPASGRFSITNASSKSASPAAVSGLRVGGLFRSSRPTCAASFTQHFFDVPQRGSAAHFCFVIFGDASISPTYSNGIDAGVVDQSDLGADAVFPNDTTGSGGVVLSAGSSDYAGVVKDFARGPDYVAITSGGSGDFHAVDPCRIAGGDLQIVAFANLNTQCPK